jgi:hypothetical protein
MSFSFEAVALRVLEWKESMGQYRKMVGGGTAVITKTTM